VAKNAFGTDKSYERAERVSGRFRPALRPREICERPTG
jgi:hypothetical protein